jgi:hypothetical protein
MTQALVVEEQEIVKKYGFEDVRTHKQEKGEQDVVVAGDGGDASRLEGGHR